MTSNAGLTPVPVGSIITYTLTVVSKGPGPATNVEMVNTLPAGVIFDSITPSSGATIDTVGMHAPCLPQHTV